MIQSPKTYVVRNNAQGISGPSSLPILPWQTDEAEIKLTLSRGALNEGEIGTGP